MAPALWPWLGCRAEVGQDILFQLSLSVIGGKGPLAFPGSSFSTEEGRNLKTDPDREGSLC